MFDPRFKTSGALAKYLGRKKLKLVALSPWLDYDPGLIDHVLSRDEYKLQTQKVLRAFHEIDPHIRVLGCIETDWVALFREKIKNGSLLEKGTPEQITKLIDDSDSPWKDSIKRHRSGHIELEHYVRGGKPQLSLSVFPKPGNAQEKFLLDQAKFLIEEVGLDGIYIDEFNQSWNRNVRSYSGWDGVSVEINSDTGEIAKKFVSCGLAGIPSRLAIMNYVFSLEKLSSPMRGPPRRGAIAARAAFLGDAGLCAGGRFKAGHETAVDWRNDGRTFGAAPSVWELRHSRRSTTT